MPDLVSPELVTVEPETAAASGRNSKVSFDELHPESLLQVPLVRTAFADEQFDFIERSVDCRWSYEKSIPLVVTGFNPFAGGSFYGQNSFFKKWLENPAQSARLCNENDFAAREVMFMAHDYIHAWSYQVMNQLFPELGLFDAEITADNFEDLVFCHLISEAAATVGLDYWQLSVKSINEYCPIGSAMGPLTVSYRESHLSEYRRANPSFEVQTPAFFKKISEFYCTGNFRGFSQSDIKRSPLLLRWLKHEIKYGVSQRELTRSFMGHLSSLQLKLTAEQLKAPLDPWSKPYRVKLVDDLGTMLWDLVKAGKTTSISWAKPEPRRAPVRRLPDFRFTNLQALPEIDWKVVKEFSQENFNFFLNQYLSGIPFDRVERERHQYISLIRERRDGGLLKFLFGTFDRLVPSRPELPDVLLAN